MKKCDQIATVKVKHVWQIQLYYLKAGLYKVLLHTVAQNQSLVCFPEGCQN